MSDLTIHNIVATGDLDTSIDFFCLLELLDLPHLKYDPAVHQGLELRFVEEGPLVTVYATGKYIIRANSIINLNQTRDRFLDLFHEEDIISGPEDKEFNINNVVGTSNIGEEFDLTALAEDLDIEDVKYEPEVFPGLRGKIQSEKGTVLLHRTGKITVTGADSIKSAQKTYEKFRQFLESLNGTIK